MPLRRRSVNSRRRESSSTALPSWERICSCARCAISPRAPRRARRQATYTRPLTRDDSPIDWDQNPRAIIKHICGLEPWPVATAELGGQTFKIHAADYSERTTHKAPGTIVAAGKDGVTVACAGGQTVRITQLQVLGKKRMSAADYLLGHTLPVEG